MICPICGGLWHIGMQHLCVIPEGAEFDRRKRRADRFHAGGGLNAGLADRMARVLSGLAEQVSADAKLHMPQTTGRPRASLDRGPIRVQAYVGKPLLELTAGQEVIDADVTE